MALSDADVQKQVNIVCDDVILLCVLSMDVIELDGKYDGSGQ